jgi:hypothetical protein
MNSTGSINMREANLKANQILLKAFRMWDNYGKEQKIKRQRL